MYPGFANPKCASTVGATSICDGARTSVCTTPAANVLLETRIGADRSIGDCPPCPPPGTWPWSETTITCQFSLANVGRDLLAPLSWPTYSSMFAIEARFVPEYAPVL